ncbi:RNA-binding S4 domain-containing protein [Timonella sp. A28]|uniref:RNA-binding S4 domain-containing protein n=1 Tax=Timonella sp. A28 TaxID=3442640 RepID=UPI003EB6B90A
METPENVGPARARVDVWVWATRLAKTRSVAAAGCRAGHVRVNNERAKPSTPVKPGDTIRVFSEAGERIVEVRTIILKRVSAPIAATCYIDHTPPPPPKEERALVAVRERGSGRPTKRERRELDRLRGHTNF